MLHTHTLSPLPAGSHCMEPNPRRENFFTSASPFLLHCQFHRCVWCEPIVSTTSAPTAPPPPPLVALLASPPPSSDEVGRLDGIFPPNECCLASAEQICEHVRSSVCVLITSLLHQHTTQHNTHARPSPAGAEGRLRTATLGAGQKVLIAT